MATVNYLTSTEISTALFSSSKLDAASQQAVINQLTIDGLINGATTQSDLYNQIVQPPLFGTGGDPTVPAGVQALEIQQFIANVETNSVLKIIIDDGSNPGASLNVIGGTDPVFIALGSAGTSVGLNDHGPDTVYSSTGNDTITGNDGADSLIGGTGNDIITDLLSGTSTLVAGSGNDTLTGLQGDTFALPSGTMVASGNDVYNIYDGPGNSTINLGSGADTVNFFTSTGNDTINHLSGGGTDTVDFTGTAPGNLGTGNTNHSISDLLPGAAGIVAGTGAQTGDYTLHFTNGQTVTLNASTVSATENAFVLKFDDGTVNLKGGS